MVRYLDTIVDGIIDENDIDMALFHVINDTGGATESCRVDHHIKNYQTLPLSTRAA